MANCIQGIGMLIDEPFYPASKRKRKKETKKETEFAKTLGLRPRAQLKLVQEHEMLSQG